MDKAKSSCVARVCHYLDDLLGGFNLGGVCHEVQVLRMCTGVWGLMQTPYYMRPF